MNETPPHILGITEIDLSTPPEDTGTPHAGDSPPAEGKRPKGKRSLPKSATERQTGKKEPYAYTIKDVAFGEFKVLNSANAWWLERLKVQKLIDAFKIDANDDEACAYAGILPKTFAYFKELHPDFLGVKSACKQTLGLKAKAALARKVEKEPEWYLERKRKDEYSTRSEVTGANGRELYDGLTAELRELGEALRSDTPTNATDTKKHTDVTRANDTDAGPDGSGHAAVVATDVLEG